MELQTHVENQPRQNNTSSPVNSEGSVLSDSDIANFSSANSTLKSDVSGGKQGRTSHQEAIATLDSFLNDVSEMTQRAKLEEEIKLQSARIEPPPTESKGQSEVRSETVPSSLSKKSNSMPSLMSEDEFRDFYSRIQKSLEDIPTVEYEVFSDEEPEISSHEKKRQVHMRNQANKSNISMSSMGSDAPVFPQTYGLTHLNHLCKFLEQYEQLQQQNTELSKRVTSLETNFAKQASGPVGVSSSKPIESSSVFAVPKDKPKKVKVKSQNPTLVNKEKLKGRTKYLALPFVLAAKSVENLKQSSSQTFDKPKVKVSQQKKTRSYAADDIEIGKISRVSEGWRNSSVKTSSGNYAEKRLPAVEPDTRQVEGTVDSPEREIEQQTITPVVVINEEASASNGDAKIPPAKPEESSIDSEKVPPLKPRSPQRSRSEERNYRNTKKMTEWGALQQAFPVPQLESNLDLLNHLETITSLHKPHAKKGPLHHGFKRPGRAKKDKNSASNMFLPSTEVPGFTSTFLAAHAMANQLTLTLNLDDLELLSAPASDPTVDELSGQAVSIS